MNNKIGSHKLYVNACHNENIFPNRCYNVESIIAKHKHNFEQEGIELEHIRYQDKKKRTTAQKVAAKIKQIRKHSKDASLYKNSKHKVRCWLKNNMNEELSEAI